MAPRIPEGEKNINKKSQSSPRIAIGKYKKNKKMGNRIPSIKFFFPSINNFFNRMDFKGFDTRVAKFFERYI